MKSVILITLFLSCACAALGQGRVQVVVPGALANVEGNSSASAPFNSTSFRFQQVFDASQFAIPLGNSGLVTQISFRLDGASTEDALLFFGGASVTLSTTPRTPDSLSPVFAANPGSDAVTVWSGALSFSGAPPAPDATAPFNPVIPVDIPFYYMPSRGNLLLDVAASGGQVFLPGSLDAHSQVGDAMSWVWSPDGNSPSGTAETLGLVTRFDIRIIPEPSIWLLAVGGTVVLGLFRRR